jgi:multisubunit Na+/H+ antiporter MnhG subunit
MGLDIRYPIGMMFAIIGALMIGLGVFSKPEAYKCALDININLIWGCILLVFGLIMYFAARKGSKDQKAAAAKEQK